VPIPATSVVNIESTAPFSGIEIYNMQGSLIEKISTKPTINYQLKIDNYSKGIYTLSLITNNGIYHEKLIKN